MNITELIPVYINHLKALGRSYYTIRGTGYGLKDLAGFLEQERVINLAALTRDILYEYQQELAFRHTAAGRLLSLRTQAQMLGTVKGFTRFLKEHDYLVYDPGAAIQLPQKPRRLPKVILSVDEINKLMAAPDTRTNNGYRDRIILEILYDTAIRRSEMAGLRLIDLDLTSGYILVHGKGDKDRVVPMSRRVCGVDRDAKMYQKSE